jgi:hypothetical protein
MLNFVKYRKFIRSKKNNKKMVAITTQNKTTKFPDTLSENKDQNNEAKSQKKVALSNNEVINQLEQNYYNKACGCSVKAQENNLFDYKSQQKIILIGTN